MSPARNVAVIDVGSNSVRLVLYRIEGRAIWTVFNEKVLAGLGRNMAQTGRLAPGGVAAALGALRRFRAVLDGMRPDEVFTAATAAVRDASDRQAFIDRVAHETGFRLRVLSGEDEARLAALGVAAGAPGATGVVGDLGGSSLELTRIEDGVPGYGATLPLGPFALGLSTQGIARTPTIEALALAASAVIAPVAARFQAETFHAVGGAWRNLALVNMSITNYPLHVVHQYEMPAAEALEASRFLARQSKGSLERIPGLTKKRAETLPSAAVVLEALIERLGVKRLVLSAYGVREGLILDAMSAELRTQDPLVEGCATLAARDATSEVFGPALEAWLSPLWSSLEPVFAKDRTRVLLAAAARLAGLGAHLHPDHRADLAFDLVLRAPIAGQTHKERAFLAIAVFNRYTTAVTNPEPEAVSRLLSPEQIGRARALGAALRLGFDLSGRSPALLDGSALSQGKGELLLTIKGASGDVLLGEQTQKRAAQLAQALRLSLKLKGS
jgi:exopolyphosphatase/guanosine-5'-triphosphate,3'-diphosphate pyrophosphatase